MFTLTYYLCAFWPGTSFKRALSYTLMSGMTSELHFLSNLSSLQIGPRTVVVWRDCKPRSRSLSRMSPYCLVFLNRTIHLSLIPYCLVFFYITVQLPLVAYCLVLFSITTNLPPIAYCLIFFYRITHLPRVAYSIVPFKLKKKFMSLSWLSVTRFYCCHTRVESFHSISFKLVLHTPTEGYWVKLLVTN